MQSLCSCRIIEFRVEVAASLRRKVHDIPDRIDLVQSTLPDIAGKARMSGVKMTQLIVFVPNKDGYSRILVSFSVLATEVVLERARARAEKSQSVPASCAGVTPQRCRICGSNNGQIEILR